MKKILLILILAAAVSQMPAASGRDADGPQTGPKIRSAAAAASQTAPSDGVVRAQMLSGLPSGWAALQNISNNAQDDEVAVGAVDNNSNAYCVWTKWYGDVGSQRDITFATNKSGSWSSPYSWSLDYTDVLDVGFPALAVTTDGGTAVVAYHDGDMSLGLMTIREREYSNGTWSSIKNISGSSDSCSYVTVSTNPVDNVIYAVWMASGDNGFELKYKYRDPSTGQWSGLMSVNGGAAGGQYLPNIYLDKSGVAHLVYIVRNGDASVWYTKNTNPKNNSGWTTPVQMSPDSGLNFTYPKVTADWNGNAYVVWQQIVSGVSSIMLRYQTSGAWGTAENISNLSDPSETATIAVNGTTNDFWVVWQTAFGYFSGNTNWDVCLKSYETDKTTGQKAWSDIYRITNYPGHAGEPQVKIQKDGDLHLFFFDNPVGDGQGEIYYSYKLAPRLAAVAAPTVTSGYDRILFASLKWNTITFAKNTNNDDTKLKEYRVYRKKAEEADSAFAQIATLGVSTFQFVDKGLSPTQRYAYIVSVVNNDGLEMKSGVTIEP